MLRDIQREEGVTILLTEHVMRAVMALADQIVVLHHGEVVARGARDRRGAGSRRARVLPGRGDAALMLSVRDVDLFYGDAQALAAFRWTSRAGSSSRSSAQTARASPR